MLNINVTDDVNISTLQRTKANAREVKLFK